MKVKPVLFASRCLGFAKCRYNGVTIPDEFVKKLKKYVKFITICPEVEVGLGIPRDSLRLVMQKENLRLMQNSSGKDLGKNMEKFSNGYLDSLPEVDGFILKYKSPSCGIKEARVYPRIEKTGAIAKKPGFFGKAVLDRFQFHPVESEMRLKSFRIRDNFLKRIYTLARFRKVKKSGKISGLKKFHENNRYLIMAYSKKGLKELDMVAANKNNEPLEKSIVEYWKKLLKTLSKSPRCRSNADVLMEAMKRLSGRLSRKERMFFTKEIKKYREGEVPVMVPLEILKSWIIRFDDKYLQEQSFFNPYPEDLVMENDIRSCKDYWKK